MDGYSRKSLSNASGYYVSVDLITSWNSLYGNTLVPFFGHHKFKKISNIFGKVKTKSKNFC
jgi:hypothetical protein